MNRFASKSGSLPANHLPRLAALLLSVIILSLATLGCGVGSSGTPDLTGISLDEAQKAAADAGLDLVQDEEVPSFLPAGTVLAQDPLPGTASGDGTMRVTISRDPIPVAVDRLAAYDPDGAPTTENDELLPRLYDGNLDTYWSTDTNYRTPDFEGLGNKIGVGFSFWLEEGATMLKISYTLTGWEGEVQRISSSELAIAIAQLTNKQQVSWRDPVTSGRIWFTRLAPLPDSNSYGAVINEVEFYR